MPTYDYDCMTCQTTVEVVHRMAIRPKIKCEKCGSVRRRRIHGLVPWLLKVNDPPQPVALSKLEETTLEVPVASLPDNGSHPHNGYIQDKDKVEHEMASDKITPLENSTGHLADNVDPNKLLVEIVQGLLMAHARLDHMEEALCQAVESASLEHLKSFDRNLNTVDLRFKQTTADAGKAVASLENVRDNLVHSVQHASIQHYDVFKSDVAKIHANIDHLRTQGVLSLAADIKAERLAEQQHFDELLKSLKYLSNNDAAQKSFGQAESTKQSENWKNLLQFLQSFRTSSATSAADLKKHTTDEAKSLSEHLASVVKLINASDANHYADIRQVRITLYWLIFFSASLIALVAATTFKIWIR
jgi:putative FmdB family regulatory protein